jgi:hypothetical protein
MTVEVIHGLTAVGFAVDHKAGAFFGAALPGRQFLGLKKKPPQQSLVFAPGFHYVPDVPFGDNKKMHRRLGRNIMEGQEFIVFVDFFGRNFSRRNFTENTAAHVSLLKTNSPGCSLPQVWGIFQYAVKTV